MKQFRIIRKVTFPGIEPERIIPSQELNEPFSLTGLTNTDQLPEGIINLYYTDARVDARIALFTGIGQANTASNVGSGIGLFKQKIGVDLEFKSLLSSNKLTITPNINGLTVDIDVNETNLTLNNIGGTLGTTKGGTGLTTLGSAGQVLTVNPSATALIWATPTGGGGGEANDGNNLGSGLGIFAGKVGVDLQFKSLTAGSNKIILSSGPDEISINVDETKLTLNNMIGPLGVAKGGTGLTVLGSALQVLRVDSGGSFLEFATISGNGEVNTASNVGTGLGSYGIFKQKTVFDLEFKSLFEDNGISIDDITDTNQLRISVFEPELDINLIGGSPLDADKGGTGFTSYVIGDLLYADTISTLAKRSIGLVGEVLTVSGGGLPVWAPVTSIPNPDVPTWVKITKNFGDLSVGALINDISLYMLPVAGVIHAIKIKHSIPFTGGGSSFYRVTLGIVGDLNKFISLFDVFSSDSDDNFIISNSFQSESHGFSTDIRISAESDVNLSDITNGSLDVWLLISRAL